MNSNAAQRADSQLSSIIHYLTDHKFADDIPDHQKNEVITFSKDCHICWNGDERDRHACRDKRLMCQ